MSNDNPPVDHAPADGDGESTPIEENIKSRSTWLRLIFMLVFYMLASVVSFVGSVVVILGFLWVLFTGEKNRQLQDVGQVIAAYVYQLVRYLTYNTDERPFPFGAELPTKGSSAGKTADESAE